MIDDTLRSVLAQEGAATFMTEGPGGPHLVATWQSLLMEMDGATLAWPAGGYFQTEVNLREGSPLRMVVAGRVGGTSLGFRLVGRAEVQKDTDLHRQVKARHPWCRAAVVLHLESVVRILG